MKPLPMLIPVLGLAFFLGCGNSQISVPTRMVGGRAAVGMEESQVIDRLGTPLETVGGGRVKYLAFPTPEAQGQIIRLNKANPFWVRIVDGKFDAYVKGPDLDYVPPAPPEPVAAPQAAPQQPVLPPPPAAPAYDLRGELERLNKLKADGLISEDEYKMLRTRVIEKAKQ